MFPRPTKYWTSFHQVGCEPSLSHTTPPYQQYLQSSLVCEVIVVPHLNPLPLRVYDPRDQVQQTKKEWLYIYYHVGVGETGVLNPHSINPRSTGG